jgi:O-antigen ligase
MSGACALPQPSERFVTGSAVGLATILFVSIMTIWVKERWSVSLLEGGLFALAAIWSGRITFRPYSIRCSFALVPLTGTVLIGLLQLLTGHTVNRWETWNAVLKWMTYLASFVIALQICSSSKHAAAFRRALLYFAFGLSVLSVLQFFTSPGKVFWLFEVEYKNEILGPFLNRDHYAAFIELVFPIALFETLVSHRKGVLYAAIAGTMFASVIAGASRAGSVLLVVEMAAVLLLTVGRGFTSLRQLRSAFIWLLALTLIFGSVVGWTKLWQRFQDPDPYRSRREMLVSSIAMTRSHPWTGFGLGNFANVYPAYAEFDNGLFVPHAHNDWVEWAAEGGIPFVGLLIALAIWSIPGAAGSIWGLGIIVMLIHSLVDFPMQKPAIAAWMFVLIGAVSAGTHSRAGSEQPEALTDISD